MGWPKGVPRKPKAATEPGAPEEDDTPEEKIDDEPDPVEAPPADGHEHLHYGGHARHG